ncbi:hypothetical protein FisN_6Hh343 [Fistulifera solaris]|uniref:Uncharacterized protein n=1 Tax=Fistulifera solaris TaxID=1519565 RepID=A0A1Z5K7D5_FISSO|nr:hypothetical protein FisN_6Hh343 [Fistulifera solaris]|eukprot:GAX22095.1 hypothetical protein FisN_6Hh343 [Fistulifera solaris]
MDVLWSTVIKGAAAVGQVAGQASMQAKCKADLMFIDRELANRQYAFGVQLYDYVAPLAKHHSFYSSDDLLTASIQPHFIAAQREIAALEIKVGKLKQKVQLTGVEKAASCAPATNWQEKLANAGKTTAYAGKEVALTTELSMVQGQITKHKQEFGVKMYADLEKLEDTQQWLPTDREIRSFYDICRRDVEKIRRKRADKEKELAELSGESVAEEKSGGGPVNPDVPPWGAAGTEPARISPQPPSNGMPWASTAPSSTSSNYPPPQPPSVYSNPAPTAYSAPPPPPVYQAPPPTYVAPPANYPPAHQPSSDPFASNDLLDFTTAPAAAPVPSATYHDPFAVTAAPTAAFQSGFDPFVGNTASTSISQSQQDDDPFAGL